MKGVASFSVIIILFSSIVFAQIESVGLGEGPSEPSEDAECGVGDGCNLKCLDGDLDCSCSSQKGNICNNDQICRGRLLKNWEGVQCCSINCEERVFINPKSIVGLFEDKEVIVEEKEDYGELKFFALGLLVGLLFYFALDMWESRNSLAYFVEREIEVAEEKGKRIFKARKKKLAEGKKGDKTKRIKAITPLLSNLMEDLHRDEKNVVMKLIGKEGIKKEELMVVLGYDRDKINYSLIKLARRGIIKLKGDDENPRIYFGEWLK